MSTSKNGLDAFERSLRDSLDQFEVPYNSADWTQMERSLNGKGRGRWVSGVGLSFLVAGLVVVAGGTWYALTDAQAASSVVSTEVPAATMAVPESGLTAEGGDANIKTSQATEHEAVPSVQRVTPAEEPDNTVASAPVATTTGSSVQPVASAKKTSTAANERLEEPAVTKAAVTSAPGLSTSTFKASVAEGCPGTAVEFKVANMPEDGIYLWNFGDGSFSNQANPAHTFTKPGSYQVMLSMSAAGVGTIQNKPSSDVIVIHESPLAAFNVLKQEYDGHLPSVHFENRSLAGKQYHWDFGDGQTSTIPHPDHIYKKKGVYQVELTVTNEIGCEDKIMKDVRIDKDYNLDAPQSFSPNGDDFQETFMPEALRTLGVKFNLTIYSANGTLLYMTNDANKPWTGRPQNRGDFCAAGEYVWVADVRESLHLAETYTGKVKLER